MQLIKFCKPEHNIHRGAKLHLGTLYGYRSIEDPAIRDVAEGTFEFNIEFPEEIELDRQWLNLLFQGLYSVGPTDDMPRFPGRFSAKVEKIHLIEDKGNSVLIKDTSVKITRNLHNSFIFCMSLMSDINKRPFADYEDQWSFPEHKANEFSVRLASLIFQQVKLNEFDDSISKIHTPASVSNLNLNVKHQKVIYKNRDLQITPKNKPSFDELVQVLSNIEFLKPESFKHENEYRFVFELNDGQKVFSPKNNSLLLSLNPLIDL